MVNLDIKAKMELILSVGQVLAQHGATADKIMANVKRVVACMQMPEASVNIKVMPSVLFLNVSDGEKSHQSFRNYENSGVDMNIVNLVDALTVRAVKKNYSPQKFNDVFDRIVSRKKIYSHTQVVLATGLFCGAFCYLFGGDLLASFYTAVSAGVGKLFQLKSIKYGVNHFCAVAIASFVASSLAYLSHFLPSETICMPFIACSLFLIPGIPIMNSITESLGGFFLNGIVKAYHSFLIAVSMTAGIVLSISVWEHVEDLDLKSLSLSAEHNLVEILLLGMIISISFSTFINTPKKILLFLGSLGVCSLLIKDLMLYRLGFSPDIATFIPSLFVGIAAIMAKKYIQSSTQGLTVPAIIAFVPGVLIFRVISSCVYIRYFNAEGFFNEMGFALDALKIIFAMTIGVTLPHLFANKLLRK